MGLLSLPNEILDQIIRNVVGNAVINPATPSGTFSSLSNIRRVNRRLADVGGIYIYFRFKVPNERELDESKSSCELRSLRKGYTRQLEVDAIPILFCLEALAAHFPLVTHLTLTRIRISRPIDEVHLYRSLVMLSVTHLSVQVTPQNENGVATLLRSFPNITTLALVSDPELYKGMNIEILLTFPSLPHLKTLYRPSMKRMNLRFMTDGFLYTAHHHASPEYNQHCQACTLWLSRIEAVEQISVTQLAWRFPRLEEVLIHRLVLEDASPVVHQSVYHRAEGSDWMEYARDLPDVAVWLIQEVDTNRDAKLSPASQYHPEVKEAATKLDIGRNPFQVVHPATTKDSMTLKFWDSRFIHTKCDFLRESAESGVIDAKKDTNAEKRAPVRPIIGPWDL